MLFKTCLLADLGATNARFSITQDGLSFENEMDLKISDFDSIDALCKHYLTSLKGITVKKAIIGVAAPVIGDLVTFVNCDLKFSIRKLNKFFSEGLYVLNDLALQAYALNTLSSENIKKIGRAKPFVDGPKILVAPGTGLGLASISIGNVTSTEAGHLIIPKINGEKELNKILDNFYKKFNRMPTFENLLSGKGLKFIYEIISSKDCPFSNEEILNRSDIDATCLKVKDILCYIYATYIRSMALAHGSTGGVYLTGSLTESLLSGLDANNFRSTFEDSASMKDMLTSIPIFIIDLKDLGFYGALVLSIRMNAGEVL